MPAKDYNTDRLSTAALQLAQGTHCIVDESCMQAGQLQEQGVNNLRVGTWLCLALRQPAGRSFPCNSGAQAKKTPAYPLVQALQCIMSDQEVPYDFEYYKLPIKTDMPVLILSSQRSILRSATALEQPQLGGVTKRRTDGSIRRFSPQTIRREAVDIQIPLNATTAVGDPDALEAALAVSDLEMVRSYLMHAKQIDFEFKEEVRCDPGAPRLALQPPGKAAEVGVEVERPK